MAKTTYSAFKTDETREQKGVILDLGDAGRFRIARAGGANAAFQKRLAEVTKPYRRAIQTGTIDTATSDKLLAQVYAESVIIGWDDVRGEDGELLAFSRDAAIQLLTDLPDLFTEIRNASQEQSYFRAELTEGDVKN